MKEVLKARNVTKVFGSGLITKGRTVAVDEVSLSVNEEKPTVIAIAGESGSGKTTLARLLLGMIRPSAGEIRFQGQNVYEMNRSNRKLFRRQVQAIFQDPFEVYNPVYKVDEVLNLPVKKFKLASSKADGQRLIEESLQKAGLRPEETLGRYPHQLSGGQRQRIMVARTLLLNPRVLLADEPVSMVDASLRATILESLMQMKRDLGVSLIYITHDLTTAYQISENIYIMYRGSVTEAGSVKKVIKQPLHPYTRLLVSSIPLPDPDRHWGGDTEIESAAASGAAIAHVEGCKFSNRCPFVMDECRKKHPPLYRTDDNRAVACYLNKDSEQVSGQEMAEALAA
jgi:oligopeptide/dipeptide ABC transporter ATP-binding protein